MKTVFVRQHICVVVASVILVSTFLSNDGWASSGSAGSEAEQQALDISATFAKWPDGAITWVYNLTKAPADYTDDGLIGIGDLVLIAKNYGLRGPVLE